MKFVQQYNTVKTTQQKQEINASESQINTHSLSKDAIGDVMESKNEVCNMKIN